MLSIHGAFKNKGPVGVLEQQITLLFCRNILQDTGSFVISLECDPREQEESVLC